MKTTLRILSRASQSAQHYFALIKAILLNENEKIKTKKKKNICIFGKKKKKTVIFVNTYV